LEKSNTEKSNPVFQPVEFSNTEFLSPLFVISVAVARVLSSPPLWVCHAVDQSFALSGRRVLRRRSCVYAHAQLMTKSKGTRTVSGKNIPRHSPVSRCYTSGGIFFQSTRFFVLVQIRVNASTSIGTSGKLYLSLGTQV
jgi:hypothetical protein